MADIQVEASRTIAAEAGQVYRCLVDFVRAQPRMLPAAARDYELVSGGTGEGTVVAFTLPVRGQDRRFTFRISEPIPNRAIVAYDRGAHLTVTWRLRPVANATEVGIEAAWTWPDTTLGFVTEWWAALTLRRAITQMLARLPAAVGDREP